MKDILPKSLALELDSLMRSAQDWNPWPYQETGLRVLLQDPCSGLLLDPGMGKTSMTLAEMSIRRKKRQIKRALIIAPKRALYEVWPQQMREWKDFHHLSMAVLHGDHKESILRELKSSSHEIVLINPESYLWLADKKERMDAVGAQALVIDESSKWKNHTSQRFKALRKQLHRFAYRHILTGSPRPKNYLDLWPQMYILDMGDTLGPYISTYRNEHFFPVPLPYNARAVDWQLLPGHDRLINKAVAPRVLRLDAKDHLKLPATPERTHKVRLPAKAMAEYEAIEERLMSTLFTQPLQNSAAARAKCCQIANGAVYTDAPDEAYRRDRPWSMVHTEKLDALVDLYDELQGEPLLVGIGYHHDVAMIRKALGSKIPCMDSRTTEKEFGSFVRAWNEGKLPLLLGHPASMGHALNLQKCDGRHVAYYWLPDNYDDYDQMFRRVWRQGNKAPFCMKHHFVSTGTTDEAKMIQLREKGNGQNAFLAAMRVYSASKAKGAKIWHAAK